MWDFFLLVAELLSYLAGWSKFRKEEQERTSKIEEQISEIKEPGVSDKMLQAHPVFGLSYSVQMSASDLISRYGISKNTVYKLLSDPPKWLGVDRISGEGYRLAIRPSRALSDRAYSYARLDCEAQNIRDFVNGKYGLCELIERDEL